jgi:hypothetical protein
MPCNGHRISLFLEAVSGLLGRISRSKNLVQVIAHFLQSTCLRMIEAITCPIIPVRNPIGAANVKSL